jgi:hypothetical protein
MKGKMYRNKFKVGVTRSVAAALGLTTISIMLSTSQAQDEVTDLSGTWWGQAPIPGEPAGGNASSPRAGVVVLSPVILTDHGQAVMATFDLLDDPAVRCEHPGLLRQIFNPYPLIVEQREGAVVIDYEEWNAQRTIYLDSETPENLEASSLGYSVGHFEGEKLIVTTTGLARGLGRIPEFVWNTEEVSVVEQYYLTERHQLVMEVEVTDPVMLRQPWRVVKTWNPHDQGLLDFDCVLRDRL